MAPVEDSLVVMDCNPRTWWCLAGRVLQPRTGTQRGQRGRALTEHDAEPLGRAEEDAKPLETHAPARGETALSPAWAPGETGAAELAREPFRILALSTRTGETECLKGEGALGSQWLAVVSQRPRKASWRRCRPWRDGGKGRLGRGSGVCRAVCAQLPGLSTGRDGTGTRPLSAAPSPAGTVGRARPATGRPGLCSRCQRRLAEWPWQAAVIFSLLPVFKARSCVPFCPVGLIWAAGPAVGRAAGPGKLRHTLAGPQVSRMSGLDIGKPRPRPWLLSSLS